MKLLKISAALITLLLLASGAYSYFYFSNLPTVAPMFVSARASIDPQPAGPACLRQQGDFAYQLSVSVSTTYDDTQLYSSLLNFKLQFASIGADKVVGSTAQATISENQQLPQHIDDMLFLSRAEGDRQLIFTAFNALGLIPQHPLMMVSQVLKNLSVGQAQEVYRFSYDALQRHYRYQQTNQQWQRSVFVPGQFSHNKWQPNWQISYAQSCMPESLNAEEIQAIQLPQGEGKMRIRMQAQRIPSFKEIRNLSYHNQANKHLQWQPASLATVKKVKNEEELWQSYQDFDDNKNMPQLVAAARYLVEHKSARELADDITHGQQEDSVKRDVIFSLGLLKAAEAEQYLLDLIQALPERGNQEELQKVRAMVALSSQEGVSDHSFNQLAALHEDGQSAANVSANALISMANIIKQQEQSGADSSNLTARLGQYIERELQMPKNSAAIYAAGNVGLNKLNPGISSQIQQQLHSSEVNSRFAAATVLSRDPANSDILNRALETETTELVRQAIINGLDQHKAK